VRSDGLMKAQESFLHFRTVPEWEALFKKSGWEIAAIKRRGRVFHKQAFFLLRRTAHEPQVL
jgi:hypothetical protein